LTNASASPADIVIVGGNDQSTRLGSTYSLPLQVQVTDRYGNPIADVAVTFRAPPSGPSGNFSASATVLTNSQGIATAPSFTANNKTGTFTVTATTQGVAAPAVFTLTNAKIHPTPQASFFLVTVPEDARAGTPARVTVVAYDAAGHRVHNYAGTISFTSTDASATLPSPYTFAAGDQGKHTFLVTFQTPGSQMVTATDTKTSSIAGSATTTVLAKPTETTLPILAQGNAWLSVQRPPQQRVLQSGHALRAVTGLKESQLAALLHVGSIDWNTQMVVMVSTGFGAIWALSPMANILELTARGHALTVHWQWLKPNPNQIIPDFVVLTNPFEFVLVDRFTGRVKFQLDD
jgi:hypothetical protein